MVIIRRHIWGFIQLTASIFLIVKWLSKPVEIGQIGRDNLVFYFLLTVIVTVNSFKHYLNLEAGRFEKRIPVFICAATFGAILIGSAINDKIEQSKKPIIAAGFKGENITLFQDNSYEYRHAEAEYIHYDRGTYHIQANKLILDKQIFVWGRKTNTFYISDTSLYVITLYRPDTLIFKRSK